MRQSLFPAPTDQAKTPHRRKRRRGKKGGGRPRQERPTFNAQLQPPEKGEARRGRCFTLDVECSDVRCWMFCLPSFPATDQGRMSNDKDRTSNVQHPTFNIQRKAGWPPMKRMNTDEFSSIAFHPCASVFIRGGFSSIQFQPGRLAGGLMSLAGRAKGRLSRGRFGLIRAVRSDLTSRYRQENRMSFGCGESEGDRPGKAVGGDDHRRRERAPVDRLCRWRTW